MSKQVSLFEEHKPYKLLLDDERTLATTYARMSKLIGRDSVVYFADNWVIVKSYDEFISTIQKEGVPELISWDHDLSLEQYLPESLWNKKGAYEEFSKGFKDKTGMDCARWFCEYLSERNLDMIPYFVHSQNPVGAENITSLLESYKKSRM